MSKDWCFCIIYFWKWY